MVTLLATACQHDAPASRSQRTWQGGTPPCQLTQATAHRTGESGDVGHADLSAQRLSAGGMASMTALLAEATRSLVQACRSGTPLLQLTEARVLRVPKAMMLAGRPWERSDVPVGLTDDMMALLELAVTLCVPLGGRGPKQALQVICQARCRCCTACTEPAVNPSAQLSFSGITTMSAAPLIQGLAHLTRQRVCGCIASIKGHWRLVMARQWSMLTWC